MTDQWARLEILRLVRRAQDAEYRCDRLEQENQRLRTAIQHVNAVLREHREEVGT